MATSHYASKEQVYEDWFNTYGFDLPRGLSKLPKTAGGFSYLRTEHGMRIDGMESEFAAYIKKNKLQNRAVADDVLITYSMLTKAIQNSFNQPIKEEDAKKMAENLLNFFGYSDRMLDNDLRPDDRDVFYMMEDAGILTTEREETHLYDGRQWRINYWLLRTKKIQELLKDKKNAGEDKKDEEKKIYENLPDTAWGK